MGMGEGNKQPPNATRKAPNANQPETEQTTKRVTGKGGSERAEWKEVPATPPTHPAPNGRREAVLTSQRPPEKAKGTEGEEGEWRRIEGKGAERKKE